MILHGRNILLLAGGTAIAAAKSCDLDVSTDIIKTASPSDGQWENSIPGRKSWKATCSQLVTGVTDPVAMVGTIVTIRMQVAGKLGMPFSGNVSNVTIEAGSAPSVTVVTWDATSKQFLAVYVNGGTTRYYSSWSANFTWKSSTDYHNAPTGSFFYDASGGDMVYKKTATDLLTEALQGSAIVREWRVTATLGNLAQGSFQFHGKGPFTNPTT